MVVVVVGVGEEPETAMYSDWGAYRPSLHWRTRTTPMIPILNRHLDPVVLLHRTHSQGSRRKARI